MELKDSQGFSQRQQRLAIIDQEGPKCGQLYSNNATSDTTHVKNPDDGSLNAEVDVVGKSHGQGGNK